MVDMSTRLLRSCVHGRVQRVGHLRPSRYVGTGHVLPASILRPGELPVVLPAQSTNPGMPMRGMPASSWSLPAGLYSSRPVRAL